MAGRPPDFTPSNDPLVRALVAEQALTGLLAKPQKIETRFFRRSLADFIVQAWPVLEPATVMLRNWHIDCIADYLTACTRRDIKRLVVNLPPRYMKSMCGTIMWPAWDWAGTPHTRWIFVSYDAGLASRHSVSRRTLLESPWYQFRWGRQVAFTSDQNEKMEYQNTARGFMMSAGVGGGITGAGGDFIVFDDPHNTQRVETKAEREKAVEFTDQTLSTRLDDKINGVIVVIMQRLHTDDVAGHLLKQGGYEHLKLTGEVERDRKTIIVFPVAKTRVLRDPDTNTTMVTKTDGETEILDDQGLLWPEREGPDEIEERKVRLGSRGFAGQYQQSPVPPGGAIWLTKWWRYYREFPGNQLYRMIHSLDTAQEEDEENDFSCDSIWGEFMERPGIYYLLWVWKGQVGFPQLRKQIRLLWEYPPTEYLKQIWRRGDAMIIEHSSSGISLIQELKQPDVIPWDVRDDPVQLAEFMKRKAIPVIPIKTMGRDKVARSEASTPIAEAGCVCLPDPDIFEVPWLPGWLTEHADFPNTVHDDQVDTTSQALGYLRGRVVGVATSEEFLI